MFRLDRMQLLAPALLCSFAAGAQGLAPGEVPFDDLKGRYVEFETTPIQPLALAGDPPRLYALNQPGARVVLYDPAQLAALDEMRVGLGAVSIVERPGSNELWVVDVVGSCISVIERDTGTLRHTIRVGAQPHGLAFTDSGERAYVTCSAVDRVDVIDAASYSVVKEIAIPARNPRGIVWHAGSAYVVSFLSGNNTAPLGSATDAQAVIAVASVTSPGVQPLPDRDLFVIHTRPNAQDDELDATATVRGLGTILFNIHVRPGTTQLWIPNTEALNATHVGEVNFIGGQVVANRITVVDAGAGTPPLFIDLDQLAPPGESCAQPTFVAFDPNQPRAYVCAYGSDRIVVLDISDVQHVAWLGAIELPPKQAYPRGTGPRACVVDQQGELLFVFDRVDNALTRIELASLPASGPFHVQAALPVTLGFNPTPTEVWLGRHLFTNARLSKSQTSSCASCHVDGGSDGLAWELSSYLDPEGTPPEELTFGVDVKGPMVTQSVRRLEESGPFHWRGERDHINKFNQTFVALLEHEQNGVPHDIGPEFQYLRQYVNRIAYLPNPRQSLDRRYSDEELEGADIFLHKPVLGSLSCAACHVLPLGTAGEIVAETVAGMIKSADVPQLRGVADKLSPAYTIGAAFGRRTELGAGLTHGGAFSSISAVALQSRPGSPGVPKFAIDAHEALRIERFLSALDTGLAPATGFQVTASADNWTQVIAGPLAFLRNQTHRGNCDLIYFCAPDPTQSNFSSRAGMYDPVSKQFIPDAADEPPSDGHDLFFQAATDRPVTFIGVPVGMGRSQALDRDMDGVFDADELALGTNPDFWDSDGDELADGYELAWGLDPLQADGPSADPDAPELAHAARLMFATTNTVKFEIETTEPCRVLVSYNGGPPVQRLPLGYHSDFEHSIIVNDLEPDTDYTFALELKDDAGNAKVDVSTSFRTRALALATPARIASIALSIMDGAGGARFLGAKVQMKAGAAAASAGYVLDASVYHVAPGGALLMIFDAVHATLGAGGMANFRLELPAPGSIPPGMLMFVVTDAHAPAGSVPYALGLNTTSLASIPY